MKILYVTSEATPFAASGGLGDVLGALPPAISKKGATVQVILPLYASMKEEYKSKLTHVKDITFGLSWRRTGASIYKYEHSGVDYFFVENHYYFDRVKLYGEYDDGERFAFFSMAVIEFMKGTDNIPDILHANDWQTALTVIYLKTLYSNDRALKNIRTVYTIHNIEYQGKYDPYILGDVFSLDESYYGVLEYDGCINLTKGAVVSSDFVTTVSPNYAYELRHDFFAFGLAKIIEGASNKMRGVINGIDYSYFSPSAGNELYKKYNLRTRKSGKAANKAALRCDLSLHDEKEVPLLVMITRLAAGKGIDLVLHIADELLKENVQLVILGTGEKEYEDAFVALEEKYPDKLRALIKFDRALSKKLYAAADIFLMPSKSEPCGLAQMIACSYGTIPVVRAVGGLFDSIIPYGEENSNGFRFDNYNAHELLFTVKRALELYKNKTEWDALVIRAMTSNFTWDRSADEYLEIYENLLNW